MSDSAKKISFGFTKLSKPTKKIEIKKNVQYIDCLESKSIRIKGEVEPAETQELVIPAKTDKILSSYHANQEKRQEQTKCVDSPKVLNNDDTLEAKAIKEILEESKETLKSDETKIFILKPVSETIQTQKEPTLEDYENVPVAEFGKAMLRGMGWNPEKGVGKNERIVAPQIPVVRPKGLGLGAETRIETPLNSGLPEELVLKKGAYVQVIGGSHKNTYGQVEGFDDDVGRALIKAALGSSRISVSESMLKVISKEEYKKYSRVLNLSKFEEIKKEENGRELRDLHENKKLKHREDFFEANGKTIPPAFKRHRK